MSRPVEPFSGETKTFTDPRLQGLRRQYGSEVLDTLAVVALCRRAGFSLAETKDLLATGGDESWKQLAGSKRDELRAQARHLTMLADQLDHALRYRSPNAFDCEHFQSALRGALPADANRQT